MIIYSDQENTTWWVGLSQQDRRELFDRMILRSESEGSRAFAVSLRDWWMSGKPMTPRQLACVRKWERRK